MECVTPTFLTIPSVCNTLATADLSDGPAGR